MKEIKNSDNSGGLIVPDDYIDNIKEFVRRGQEERELWAQAVKDGNAYYINEDGERVKI